jgi:hypothetical protein
MESQNLLIHARFSPDGTVSEIGDRPQGFTPQDWFNYLSIEAGAAYQVLAGGRGVFRLTRESVDAFKASATAQAAGAPA